MGYVPKISLDDYRIENQIPRVDFIKIDVEGSEMNVLEGAKHLIETDNPTIVIESDTNFTGVEKQKTLFQYLESL